MQPHLSRVSTQAHQLAVLSQQALAWLPAVAARRSTSDQLRDHCKRLRHHLLLVRRNHKPAWEAFALVAGKDGFALWNVDRVESAHQAVATIAHRIYQLLGGRGIARCNDGSAAPARLLRLELQLRRFIEAVLPGFDLDKPAMPLGIFHALAWELRAAQAAGRSPSTADALPPEHALPRAELIAPNSEWERLGPERREIFLRFLRLRKHAASGKEILGHKPSKNEEGHLQQLVKLEFLRKPGGKSGKDRRGYCLGRRPEGFSEEQLSHAG